MTKRQFLNRVRSLNSENRRRIMELAEKALKSGALNLELEADNYALPKAFMHVACKECASQWLPLTISGKEAANNLKHFL